MEYKIVLFHSYQDGAYDKLPDNLKEEYKGVVSTFKRKDGTSEKYLQCSIMLIYHNDKIIDYYDDAMEIEDVTFSRDLDWIEKELLRAYELGRRTSKEGMSQDNIFDT